MSDEQEAERQCRVCGVTQPIEQFQRRGKATALRFHQCRACRRARNRATRRQWQATHPDKMQAYRAAWRERQGPADPEQRRADARAYYAAHRAAILAGATARYHADPEQSRAAGRAWYAAHRATILAGVAARYHANQDKGRRRCRLYRARRPEVKAAQAARYRARARQAGAGFTGADVRAILRAQAGRCAYCHVILTRYHVDHRVPLARGGANDASNLAVACPLCNLRKGTKTDEEFLMVLARAPRRQDA